MDLLMLARGPLLEVSLGIFAGGILWRLVGIFLLRGSRHWSQPRHRETWKGLRLIAKRSVPRKEFAATLFVEVTGYVFHLAFFVALLFYLPHVLFFEDILKGLVGVTLTGYARLVWPTLPGDVIYFSAAVSLAGLMVVLVHRLGNPVLRLISSFDDYFSWLVTVAPVVTGMLASAHLGARYETLLALHIFSFEALLVWFPFGKLMHTFSMFVLRGLTGMRLERRGAAL